jgi:hypothetical protein
MHWPFKTTAKFSPMTRNYGSNILLANNSVAAKYELERRLIDQEVFGYNRKVELATKQEAALSATSRLHSAVRLAASVQLGALTPASKRTPQGNTENRNCASVSYCTCSRSATGQSIYRPW